MATETSPKNESGGPNVYLCHGPHESPERRQGERRRPSSHPTTYYYEDKYDGERRVADRRGAEQPSEEPHPNWADVVDRETFGLWLFEEEWCSPEFYNLVMETFDRAAREYADKEEA